MLYNNSKIKIKVDLRIFLLFSALNICGYNDENDKKGMSKIRIFIRNSLKSEQAKLSELKEYFAKNEPWKLSWRILHFNNPPRMTIKIKDWYTKSLTKEDIRFLNVLKKLYLTNKFVTARKIANPYYLKEIKGYRNKLNKEYQNLLDWLPITSYPFKTVIVLPNLLDAHWRGFAPMIGGTLFIVMGPSGNKSPSKLFRHELLHGIFSKNNKDKFVQCVWAKINSNQNIEKLEQNIKTEYLVKKIEKLYQNGIKKEKINKEILLILI